MANADKEYLRYPGRATRVGPDLTAIAERLIGELPEPCRNRCGLAGSLCLAIASADRWIPQTPRAAQISVRTVNGGWLMPSGAEFALRSLVRSANECDEQGPKGDGTVCCIETRDIQSAVYTD